MVKAASLSSLRRLDPRVWMVPDDIVRTDLGSRIIGRAVLLDLAASVHLQPM